jgi:CDP-diacylglycerol--glycerol-3-phosphate 3-phosphatidyltransferase
MNIPNVLSIFRLCLVPVFILTYFDGAPNATLRAAAVYAIAAATDVMDGYIARKFDKTSQLGRVLDPLADKLMAFSVLVCITIDELIPIWAVTVFFVKECLMGIGAALLFKRISDTPPSNAFGKISTVAFFAVCVILIVGKGYIPGPVPEILITAAIVLMLLAFATYVQKFVILEKNNKPVGKEKTNTLPDNKQI